MNIRSLVSRLVLIFLFMMCSSQVVMGAQRYLKEDTSKKCAICHYQWVPTFYLEHRSTPIARSNEKLLETFSWEMCISCHDSSVRDSRRKICDDPGHQVGRVPSKRVTIPPEFPLDEQGALKCTTCHTPHAVTEGSDSMVESFLRAPNEDSSFCRVCHKGKLGGLSRGNHPLDVTAQVATGVITRAGGKFGLSIPNQIICETCHTAHGGVNEKFLVLPVEDIGSMSILCEVCHTKNAVRPGKELDKTLSHPVDVIPGRIVEIPPVWTNGEHVVVGKRGELVCRTCHKPHGADREYLLAIPEGRRELCLQCHKREVFVNEPVYDLWEPGSSDQKNSSDGVAEGLVCSSCHRIHENIALFRTLDREQFTSDPMFTLPHFGLHPRTCFATAFDEKGGESADGICLFSKGGDRSDNGTIVCATCHLMFQDRADEPAGIVKEETDSPADFFRPHIAETFCKTCHGKESLVRFLYFHSKW
jgi:predicted CXXCH cytochrome family protein